MYRHASTCLVGPGLRSRTWGQEGPDEKSLPEDSIGCLDRLNQPVQGELRLDLIARVRAEIAAGIYDTPEKWEIALERLSDRLDLD
jgi:hypothetical protein